VGGGFGPTARAGWGRRARKTQPTSSPYPFRLDPPLTLFGRVSVFWWAR
jgi:hypothetical protein